MSTQVTWDTFIARPPTMERRVIHLKNEYPWEYCTTRQDAEVIVRDIGKMPQGGATYDRLMEGGTPIPDNASLWDPDDKELHYWSHNTRGYTKRIRYDGTIYDEIVVRKKGGKGWACNTYKIIGARIEGDELILETEKADYAIEIRPAHKDSMCNYIDAGFDPEHYTEHLLIYALAHGKTPLDIRRFIGVSQPIHLSMFDPFTRIPGGKMVPSKSFNVMMDFAHELGLRPKVSQDVQPYRAYVVPVAYRRYCQRRALGICDKSKNASDCVGCHQFYSSPDMVIAPKDAYDYKGRKKDPGYCEVIE